MDEKTKLINTLVDDVCVPLLAEKGPRDEVWRLIKNLRLSAAGTQLIEAYLWAVYVVKTRKPTWMCRKDVLDAIFCDLAEYVDRAIPLPDEQGLRDMVGKMLVTIALAREGGGFR